MTLGEFIKFAKDDYFYLVVDADQIGYMSHPERCTLGEGNRAAIGPEFGNMKLVGFDIVTKRRIMVYARKTA